MENRRHGRDMSTWLMIDIETMSTEPDASVLSIGAVGFSPYEIGHFMGEPFYINISLRSNEEHSRHLSADTMEFWLKQRTEALRAMFEGEVTNLKQACKRFRMWAQDLKPAVTHVMANDPDFDVVILKQAFKACGENWPWGFWINRSYRTWTELAYPDPDERRELLARCRGEGIHHNAGDDAKAQALCVQHCYQMLRSGEAFNGKE